MSTVNPATPLNYLVSLQIYNFRCTKKAELCLATNGRGSIIRGYRFKYFFFTLTLFAQLHAPQRVKKVSQSLKYNDPLRKYMDVIISKFPEDLQAEFSKGRDDYEDFEGSTEDMLTKSSLETLLKKAIKATRLSKASRM